MESTSVSAIHEANQRSLPADQAEIANAIITDAVKYTIRVPERATPPPQAPQRAPISRD
jgi:hypothetical protein